MAAATPFLNSGRTDTPRRRVRPTTEEGVPGYTFFGGFIDANERNAKLTGTQRYKTFSDIMANTAIVAAGVRYYLNLITKAGWTVVPPEMENASDQIEADRLAELTDDIINDMERPWSRVVRRSAMYRFFGFAVQEWTAKRREDGVIGMKDIAPRPQHTIEQWDLDIHGNVFGIIQRSPQDGREIYLNRGKVIYLVDDAMSDSPEGLGIMRHLVDGATRLTLWEKLESYAFEIDLRGLPVIKGPFAQIEDEVRAEDLTREDADAMIAPLRQFIENHIKSPTRGLMLDSAVYSSLDDASTPSSTPQWDFSIMNGSSQGEDSAAAAIMRVNHELARIMGVEGLLTGGSERGTQALSVDKSLNFGLLIDSALKEIKQQYERDIIGPLWSMNGWPDEMKPTFSTEQIQYRDIEQITNALVSLSNAVGPLPSDYEGINTVVELIGLPPVDLEANALDASLLDRNGDTLPDPSDEVDTDPSPNDDDLEERTDE